MSERFKNAREGNTRGITKSRSRKEVHQGGSWNVNRVASKTGEEGGKQQRQGGRRGRGGRGGRGRGRGGAKPTLENLDKDLEAYMFKDQDKAKSMLDNDLDTYMMEVDSKTA